MSWPSVGIVNLKQLYESTDGATGKQYREQRADGFVLLDQGTYSKELVAL